MNLEQYVRSGYSLYLDFANAVAAILESALAAANPPFHIQYIQRRAKAIESLAHKIPNRERLDPEHIEHDIKDLAGCRLIFYTNSEVDRFNASGILRANFTVDYTRTKVHHPVPGQNASEFRSTNVVLSLTEDRVKLPEYERFKGLFCEVQVQTILNHAWADTAHAVTYKRPNLQGVGEKQLKLIDDRLTRIMNDFLLPAGYEFQKVWEDYERVLKGKELIDLGAGDDLATRPNNNDRQNLLKGIRDYLLPALDDPHSQYPELQKKITASVSIARKSKPQPIEVPGGQFDGVTIEQYLDLVLEILSDYRYADIEGTFDAICELYLGAETEPERQKVLGVAEKLAEHQLDVWQQAGPYIQGLLIARISALPSEERRRLGPIIATIARNVLSSNVTGTRSTYNKITISTGAVAPSEALSNIRKDTIKLLISLYAETTGEQERRVIIHALLEATRTPSQVQASDALLAEILSDTADIIDFFTSLVPTEIFEVLQKIEHAVLLRHRWNVDIAKDRSAGDPVLAQFSRQEASVTRFRAAVDASSEFIVFKTLVGYDSVFPPAWSDDDFEVRGEDDYRAERIDEYVADISASNSEDWFKIIERCAQSVSNDGATFRFFHLFLDRFGERKPRVALTLLSKMTTTVAPFLPPLLSGLAKSEEKESAEKKVDEWLKDEFYVLPLARFLSSAPKFDLRRTKRILEISMKHGDLQTAFYVLDGALGRRKENVPRIEELIVQPALRFMTDRNDTRWIAGAWYLKSEDAILASPTKSTVDEVLRNLELVDRVEHHVEAVLKQVSKNFPREVIDLFVRRLENRSTRGDKIHPLPFELHKLREPLKAEINYLLETAKKLYASPDTATRYRATHLVRMVFPEFPAEVQDALEEKLESQDRGDLEFVVAMLREYESAEVVLDELSKAVIEAVPEDDELLGEVRVALLGTGLVAGPFGFVEAYKTKKLALEGWLKDPRAKVRDFAEKFISSLNNDIAAEQRSAEQDLAMRKLKYGDDEDGHEDDRS